MEASPPSSADHPAIRQLFADYLRMYAGRDDRLTALFSDDFSGFTGGGDFLVKDRERWVAITRQDFAQVKEPIRIELKDVAVQSLADTIAVATGFFTIHLPIKDHVLSREVARLVLIFRLESGTWKISHSSISIPYSLVREGEIYPLQELTERNRALEETVAERTRLLSEANHNLHRSNDELARKIVEQQAAEAALQRSEQLYRSILHASPDDITIADAEGRILMISPAAFTVFGYRRDFDFRGTRVLDYIVPEDRPRAVAQLAQKLRGVITGPSEYRGLRQDGRSFDVEVNSEFIRDAAGSPTGMVVIVRDISERKQAAAEKEKLEAQNRQLQKAESLARMAGAIAHHFNNQLQAVMMSLELARTELADDAAAGEFMAEAMQSARKAAGMSSLMLTYLGQTVTERAPLDLAAVCDRNLGPLRTMMPAGVALIADLALPGPVVRAEANQIEHLLTHLVTNAWEAGGADARAVRLGVRAGPVAEIAERNRFPVGGRLPAAAYACLEVADTGCGIVAAEIERIFDPFYSSKFPGRGMGLAVVLGIARALDGAVTVESEPGRGSVFRVYLPVMADGAERVVGSGYRVDPNPEL